MIDITKELIKAIDFDCTEIQSIEEPVNNYTIAGTVIITDDREFKTDLDEPFSEYIRGEQTIEIDIELLNCDGENVNYTFDQKEIELHLNN